MVRKVLSKEKIIEAAEQFIEERGYKEFSVRELAVRLGIKAASLYNYIENIDELSRDVGLKALGELTGRQRQAAAGKERGEALLALAVAYRSFAQERPQLYKVLMDLPDMEDRKLLHTGGEIIAPLMSVLEQYAVTDEDRMRYQRILRSIMHGFADLEAAGYFAHFPIDNDESYRLAIADVADRLEALERGRD